MKPCRVCNKYAAMPNDVVCCGCQRKADEWSGDDGREYRQKVADVREANGRTIGDAVSTRKEKCVY